MKIKIVTLESILSGKHYTMLEKPMNTVKKLWIVSENYIQLNNIFISKCFFKCRKSIFLRFLKIRKTFLGIAVFEKTLYIVFLESLRNNKESWKSIFILIYSVKEKCRYVELIVYWWNIWCIYFLCSRKKSINANNVGAAKRYNLLHFLSHQSCSKYEKYGNFSIIIVT